MSALPLAIILSLARDAACIAPGVPAEYYVAVVQQESAADPLALHDDTPPGTPYHPATVDEAERIAKRLLAQGHSVGVGLGQLTARSEPAFEAKFGLSVREALANPCANMRAGSGLLQRGLRAALSTYNCGGPVCAPGYVRQVLARVPESDVAQQKAEARKPPDDTEGDDQSLTETYEDR